MARQAKAGARARPWFGSSGIGVDQTHHARMMPAVVVTEKAVFVFDGPGNVPGGQIEFPAGAEDLPAAVHAFSWMTADA